ncbi:unnamed protein product [Sphenostylis stenocarpa]|uniref:Uncharacterized protein n=1 Tax=Sphenostylis stenocarpa TaxID=92480 RepID=A0AA86SFE4_9FABA|nr:unnamed protein product [Sphenostylis stenocarpa]
MQPEGEDVGKRQEVSDEEACEFLKFIQQSKYKDEFKCVDGLKKNNQGLSSLLEIPEKKDMYGLGYKLTKEDIKRVME